MTRRPSDAWVSAEEVCAAGACPSGVRAWMNKRTPDATASPMSAVLKLHAENQDDLEWMDKVRGVHGDGDGDGDGYGYGYGNGYGNGNGDGYGNGNGDGDGDGYGYGYGYGNGYGYVYGYGYGDC